MKTDEAMKFCTVALVEGLISVLLPVDLRTVSPETQFWLDIVGYGFILSGVLTVAPVLWAIVKGKIKD